MNDLVKLTGQELVVQDMEVTLYDIAKKFGRDHSKMVRAFEKDLNALSMASRTTRQYIESLIKVKTGNGTKRTYPTYKVDAKTAVRIRDVYYIR